MNKSLLSIFCYKEDNKFIQGHYPDEEDIRIFTKYMIPHQNIKNRIVHSSIFYETERTTTF